MNLDKANEEVVKYEAQIREAKGGFGKEKYDKIFC